MHAHLRVARPVSDLSRLARMYMDGLSFEQLGNFSDHDGFDGVMIGNLKSGFHFELTYCRRHPVAPSPTSEDLLVFYVPDEEQWQARCTAMATAGFVQVEPFNPYWALSGRTFQDPDGYRIVIQCAEWPGKS